MLQKNFIVLFYIIPNEPSDKINALIQFSILVLELAKYPKDENRHGGVKSKREHNSHVSHPNKREKRR